MSEPVIDPRSAPISVWIKGLRLSATADREEAELGSLAHRVLRLEGILLDLYDLLGANGIRFNTANEEALHKAAPGDRYCCERHNANCTDIEEVCCWSCPLYQEVAVDG